MVVRQKINNFNSVAVNKKDNYCRKRTEAVEQRSHFWHFSKNYQYANQSNIQNQKCIVVFLYKGCFMDCGYILRQPNLILV